MRADASHVSRADIQNVTNMSKYLISHFKGVCRLKIDPDVNTNDFPRDGKGQIEDICDVYIDCRNGCRIYHYGGSVLQAYIPSKIRGQKYARELKDVIFDVEETDKEVLFKFNVADVDIIVTTIKPKTNGASISPYSSKNLPKGEKYVIPQDHISTYTNLVIGADGLRVARLTSDFIKKYMQNVQNPNRYKGKEFIHSSGEEYWNSFIDFLKESIHG